ncbi:MAG TPA: preprotein translocase subunit TatB [Noviherbaspirillum sp.]|nr:preprotein translocase subunit TatB [Noviherbaspirillum sp.]
MKISLMKVWVIWRRFRQGSPKHVDQHLLCQAQLEALMRRADPSSDWTVRANWMIDVAEWMRSRPNVSLLGDHAWRRIRHSRTRFLLDWLDGHRDVRRAVQLTLQKTLREAVGPELFCATGLPSEPAFFSELSGRVAKAVMPRALVQTDLSLLFTTMFPQPSDAGWLTDLDHTTLNRLWKLCADDGIAHKFQQQIDEALTYLASMVIAVGISPEFRQRLEPATPLQATPFLALRRELEKYLLAGAGGEAALRSVRMLIAVCQAQTDRIYAHLDEYGVSVSLVYRVERMRAQLVRMARLIELRSATMAGQTSAQVKALLAELVDAHHHRSSVGGLFSRSFSLLARKMVERNTSHGEQYAARDRAQCHSRLKAGWRGGAVMAFSVLVAGVLSAVGPAGFFGGVASSLNYAASLFVVFVAGGAIAATQSPVTAPALASRMEDLDNDNGLRGLMTEVAGILRAQAATLFGNLMTVVPVMALISVLTMFVVGMPMMNGERAHETLKGLSLAGPTPLMAAATGVLFWLSSVAAGFVDNWFALGKMRIALGQHRRLVQALGAARADRFAVWLEKHVAAIAGLVSLALLFGMSPVLAQFFGLPFDVRHITLSAGALTAAAGSIGWPVMTSVEFWLAVGGIVLTGVINVSVAFGCALVLALRARDVPGHVRRTVYQALLRRIVLAPRSFLLPERRMATVVPLHLSTERRNEVGRSRKTG